MTWTRLSDDFYDRPAMLRVSRSARLLHSEVIVWCNRMLTDGTLPANALRRITDSTTLESDIDELERAELWERIDLETWQVDWTDQESAADVRERRVLSAERSKRYRNHNRGDHSLCGPTSKCRVTRGVQRDDRGHVTVYDTPSRPHPTPPGPKEPGGGRASKPAAGRPGVHAPLRGSRCSEGELIVREGDGSTSCCDTCAQLGEGRAAS